MRVAAAILAIVTMLAAGAASATPTTVAYRLTPSFDRDVLATLAIEMRFRGEADGETVVLLPDSWGGEQDLSELIGSVAVRGATMARPEPAKLVLRHRPGREITLTYEVSSGYARAPVAGDTDRNPYRPIITPSWFSVIGYTVFAELEGPSSRPADFRYGDLPFGWRVASDLDHGNLTVQRLRQSVIVGGPTLEVVGIGPYLRLAALGDWAFDRAGLIERLERIDAASLSLWGDERAPFLIAMTPIVPVPQARSLGGTGLEDAFSLYALTSTPQDAFDWLLAHERLHSWIPGAIGGMPETDEARDYWLSEGFTDFYTGRLLLRSGVWDLDRFVADFNERLKAYGASEVRSAPNAAIAEGFWTSRELGQLPYQRGMMLAALWDHRVRTASGGARDLDDVLIAMKGPRKDGETAVSRLQRVAPALGLDLGDDLLRLVERGEPVWLPADLFGDCARIETAEHRRFDPGFDAGSLRRDKPFAVGVRADGPAFAAGLREGDLLSGWSIRFGDVNQDAELRVKGADGGERTLRFRPVGESAAVQQIVLTVGADAADRARCAGLMSGAG